jgi:mRNA-degrading endonuclease RelE of RelBE toxin-antitoxin system
VIGWGDFREIADSVRVGAAERQTVRCFGITGAVVALADVRQWRIVCRVRFVETAVFTKRIVDLLSDAEYTRLQRFLIQDPRAGKVIQATGGLRKLRWGDESRHRGKRGGVRVIYYWYQKGEEFYMLLAFSKDDQEDLTAVQKRVLRQLVEQEFA